MAPGDAHPYLALFYLEIFIEKRKPRQWLWRGWCLVLAQGVDLLAHLADEVVDLVLVGEGHELVSVQREAATEEAQPVRLARVHLEQDGEAATTDVAAAGLAHEDGAHVVGRVDAQTTPPRLLRRRRVGDLQLLLLELQRVLGRVEPLLEELQRGEQLPHLLGGDVVLATRLGGAVLQNVVHGAHSFLCG